MTLLSRAFSSVRHPSQSISSSIQSFSSTADYSSTAHNDKTCDIAIIGAGIMGLNTAYQIARRCPSTKIKIFEKSAGAGYGSSGASSAICRTFYTFENQIRLSQDGIHLYQHWNDYLQYHASAAFTKTGMLIMAPMTKQEVTEHQIKYSKLGISTCIVDKNMMTSRFPQINADIGFFDNNGEKEFVPKEMDQDTFFFYEENSGYFEPVQALTDLRNVLKDNFSSTVSFYFNTNVNKILHSSGRVKGLQIESNYTGLDEIYCDTIVNASGPWYNKVINELDLDIPFTLSPVRIQVIYKDCPELFAENALAAKENGVPIPVIHDVFGGVYMRPQKQSKQILCSTTKEEEERDRIDPDNELPFGADPEYRNKYLNSMHHRLEPILTATSSKVQSLNGIYTVCEQDVHYIIGPTKLKGFIVCNGFSGHGFKCAPAVGSMIAQNITNIKVEGDTNVPIGFYSPYRKPHAIKVKNVMA